MLRVLITVFTYCWLISASANDAINNTIDRFHAAAAEANYNEYFDLLADEGVFLGTDASERWTKEEFKAFVLPHFSKGNGWSYQSTQRNITFIESTDTVFFDELLINDFYGQCRGSGILIKRNNKWQILQYNLSIPVPNQLSEDIVSLIKKHE
ncbi:MAG: nuclear transport factor 2 family protein [Colwelliaceae bacterium]|nr:nuclear transport factor 2 family protein [Colwelliaceae bacterium]